MVKKHVSKLWGVALSLVMVMGLSACVPQDAGMTEEQAANRQYMAQVNQLMDDLDDRLDQFDDAVSRGDVVTMRTQADNAFSVLDQLSNVTVPDSLQEIQTDYVNGCNSLKDALNSYIDLYTEISSATSAQPFDYSTYDSRLAAIQSTYNDGIASLQAGDQKAAEL